MTTPEIRRSQIKGFVNFQEELGGIVPSKLSNNTTILVETNQYIYEIIVKHKKDKTCYIVNTASPACRGQKLCLKMLAYYSKLKYEMPDWIGKGMRLIFKFSKGPSILIGEVIGATIIGDGYKYDVWPKEDIS